MPIWAYCYCGFIVFGTIYNLFDKNKIKNAYQVSGEILCGLCGVSVFLMAYSFVDVENTALISTLLVTYTILWAYHAHRHYFNYDYFKFDFHKAQIEAHEKLVQEVSEIIASAIAEGAEPEDFDEIEEEYNFERTEKFAHYLYFGTMIFIVFLSLPYFYVFLKLVNAVGSQ